VPQVAQMPSPWQLRAAVYFFFAPGVPLGVALGEPLGDALGSAEGIALGAAVETGSVFGPAPPSDLHSFAELQVRSGPQSESMRHATQRRS
jgi:hypothetical protein